MKKTFQKTLIAAAAGVALLSAVGTASANSLLFPYYSNAAGAVSVITLSNAGAAPADTDTHYVYNYGDSCKHYDVAGKLTANDVITHSLSEPASQTTFGMVTNVLQGTYAEKSKPGYAAPLDTGVGFLTVSSTSIAAGDALRGSLAIMDTGTGLMMSYSPVDNAGDSTVAVGVAGAEGNFNTITDTTFNLVSLPEQVVDTTWFTMVVGDMSAAIAAKADWWAGAVIHSGVGTTNPVRIYDHDETPLSGPERLNIVCQGRFHAKDLMTAAVSSFVGTKNGSFMKVQATMMAAATVLGTTADPTPLIAAGSKVKGSRFLLDATNKADTSTTTYAGTGLVMLKLQNVKAYQFGGKNVQLQHREMAAPL